MSERFDRSEDLFDRLYQRARQQFVPTETKDVMTKEGLKEARELLIRAIDDGITTGAALARRTGLKAGAISNFKKDAWEGAASTQMECASLVSRAIDQILRERAAKSSEVGGFATTRIAEQIYALTQWAITRRKIVAFVINAGLGKTITLEALTMEHAGSVLITVRQTHRNPRGFFQLWCHALGIPDHGTAGTIQDRLIQYFLRKPDSQRPIFVDEAHKLTVASLDAMREVWDAAKIPIVLAATPTLRQTLTARPVGTETQELMDQLYSRVALTRDMSSYLENPHTGKEEPLVTVEDVRRIFAAAKVRIARDGLQFLASLACTPGAGGYRTCTSLVQLVMDIREEGDQGEITLAMIREALVTSLGAKHAEHFVRSVDVQRKLLATA